MTKRQIQSMFVSSIEVLDSLVAEYEERLGVESQQLRYANKQDIHMMFEGFYNRLKFMLEMVCERIEEGYMNLQRVDQINQNQKLHQTIESKNIMEYDDCLFPQTKTIVKKQLVKNPSTDEDLYQLVVQMKQKSQEDKLKIISLEKSLSEGQKQIRQLQNKLIKTSQQIQQKQLKMNQLSQQLINIKDENDKIVEEIKLKTNKIFEIQEKYEKLESQLMIKNEQLKRLQMIQSLHESVKIENNIKQTKLNEIQSNLANQIKQKQQLKEKLHTFQQSTQNLITENKKLRNIIAKKLALIDEKTLNLNKQNLSGNIKFEKLQNTKTQINNQAYQYVRSIVEPMLKDKKFLQSQVESQLKIFINNFIKQQGYLNKNISIKKNTQKNMVKQQNL